MANLVNVFQQELDNSGNILNGGKIYVYDFETVNLSSVYVNELGVAGTNPVILSSSGRAGIFLDAGVYSFLLTDSSDNTIATRNGVSVIGGLAGTGSTQTVESMADLRALASGSSTYVDMVGYYTKGDQGAGKFHWDEDATGEDGGYTIQPNSAPVTGRWKRFRNGEMMRPEHFGAYADGTTDDSPYIEAMFDVARQTGNILAPGAEQEGQYRLPIFDFSNATFLITERIIVNQRHNFKGATFICSGNGDGFKIATNPIPAGVINNDEVDCCFLVIDGGYLSDCTIRADTTLDVTGNESIWLVCAQEIYGKKPLSNLVLNGSATGKNLGMLTARWCTTSTIADVGGTYFGKGFRAYSSNQMTYQSLFAQHIRSGATNYPFDFDTVGRFTVQGCWHEQGGILTTVYIFRNSAFGNVHALQIGDASGDTGSLIGTPTTTVLQTDLSNATDDYYNGQTFVMSNGPYAGEHAVILDYVGSTKTVTLTTPLSGAPSAGSNFKIASYDTGVKVQSCEDMNFTGAEISSNVVFNTAKTTVTASSRYSFDRTYSVTPDTYQYQASGQLLNMDLSDTSERFFIGYIPDGGRLVLNCVSRSGAITTPSFNIYKVVAGVETLLGNIAYLSFTNIGERKSKEFDIVSTQVHYISPSAGTGDVDIDWEFKLYDV